MAKKKQNKCEKCKYYDGENCFHHTNMGFKIQYRLEQGIFIKTIEELNKNGNCKNYEKVKL